MEIKYTPKEPPKCDPVSLVQTVKSVAIDKDGKRATDPKEIYTDPKHDPDAGKVGLDPVKDSMGEPVNVDYNKCRKAPYYVQGEKNQSVVLTDVPGGWFGVKDSIKKIEMTFEVCAICPDTAECLGCVSWQMISSRDDRSHIISVISDKEKKCSDVFEKAVKNFVKSHSKIDPRDDKLKWFCPDIKEGLKGLNGKPLDPYDGEVSKGFAENVLKVVYHPKLKCIELDREKAGGGAQFQNISQALKAYNTAPSRGCLKFTWSGFQFSTTPGVIFTGLSNLSAEDIAPYVQNDDRWANDFAAMYFSP